LHLHKLHILQWKFANNLFTKTDNNFAV